MKCLFREILLFDYFQIRMHFEVSTADFFKWRRCQLNMGGTEIELDWLLDLGGGVGRSYQTLLKYGPADLIVLNRSLDELANMWQRHLYEYVPLQYLVGICPWRDFDLEVSSSALIPRQETELLVDFGLQKVNKKKDFGCWADLGTGSGALAVAFSRELPQWSGHAVDCCKNALQLAEKNLRRLAPQANCKIHNGHWWEPLRDCWGAIDLAVANPPYIPQKDIDNLDAVVRDHEPLLALRGGDDGLDSCRQVIAGAFMGLAPKGWMLMEHHHDQSELVVELMGNAGLVEVSVEKDLEGVLRFAIGRHP